MKVVSSKNLPARLPTVPTIVAGMACDYWNAPEWLWGVFGVLFLIIWVASIHKMVRQEDVDFFKEEGQ